MHSPISPKNVKSRIPILLHFPQHLPTRFPLLTIFGKARGYTLSPRPPSPLRRWTPAFPVPSGRTGPDRAEFYPPLRGKLSKGVTFPAESGTGCDYTAYPSFMGTIMSELHGVRSAARVLGVTPTSVYVSTARGDLRVRVDPADGQMLWDADDLALFRERLDAEKAARELASLAARDARFKAVNSRR